jgi:hypothetical protein
MYLEHGFPPGLVFAPEDQELLKPSTIRPLTISKHASVQHVRSGSWLCENAKTLNRDRRSYSSKTVLVAQRASGFNLEIELKNIILRRVSIFEFLHMG